MAFKRTKRITLSVAMSSFKIRDRSVVYFIPQILHPCQKDCYRDLMTSFLSNSTVIDCFHLKFVLCFQAHQTLMKNDITLGYLSDFTQLPLEPQRLLYYFIKQYSLTSEDRVWSKSEHFHFNAAMFAFRQDLCCMSFPIFIRFCHLFTAVLKRHTVPMYNLIERNKY